MIRKTSKNENIYFSYQISNKAYTTKPERNGYNYGARNFSWTHTNINDFVKCIEKGYIIAPSERNLESALKSPVQIVCYDIEHTPVPMEEYVNNLSIKPTVYYNSFSHGTTPNDNRFRLVYVFDEPFSGSDYQSIYNAISDENCMGKELDRLTVNQCYNGTNKQVFNTGIVYEVPDNLESIKSNSIYTPQSFTNRCDTFSDFKTMNFTDFISKYDNEFGMEIPTHTPYVDSGDERYSVCPEEYYEIPRKTRWNKELKTTVTLRWKKGEKRHRKIYIAGIVWRHLIPDVTPEQMLYLITKEVCQYYEMADGKFTKQYIKSVVNNIMNADLNKCLSEIKHSSFKVNDYYCYQNKVSKLDVVREVAAEQRRKSKEYRYSIIDTLFRTDLSDADNLTLLNDTGIDISIATLKRYKKDRGLSRTNRKKVSPEKVQSIKSNSIYIPISFTNRCDTFSCEEILSLYDFGMDEYNNWKNIINYYSISYDELYWIVQPYVCSDDVFVLTERQVKLYEKEKNSKVHPIHPNYEFYDTQAEEQPEEEKKESLFNSTTYYNPYEYEAEQQRLEDFSENVMNTFFENGSENYVRDAMEDVMATLNVLTGGKIYE